MKRHSKGFTLVELIIVIAVIGVLAAILIPVFSNVIKKANAKSALSDARNAISAYAAEVLDRQIMGDTTYPELITIIVQKGGRYYLFGYDTRHGSSLLVSNANEEGIEASNFNDLVTRYSWNGLDGSAYDPFDGNAYPSGDHGYFYLAPADQSNTNMRGIPGTRDANTYRRLDNDNNLGLNVGRDAEIYQGTLVAGTFEGVMFDGENPVVSTVKYHISYKAGDNAPASLVLPATQEVEENDPATVAGNPDYTLSESEYKFNGWYLNNTGDDQRGQVISHVTSDMEYTARWIPVQRYTITINLNGGSMNLTSFGYDTNNQREVREDAGTTVAGIIQSFGSTEPTRTGYNFKGWFYDTGDGNVPYNGQATTLTGDITFTARWNETYQLTFDVGEGSFADGDPSGRHEVPYDVTFPADPTPPAGKVFKGWAVHGSESEFRYFSDSEHYEMNGNLTFDATYGMLKATFYDGVAGGEPIAVVDVAVGGTPVAPEAPAHDGYTFSAWTPAIGPINTDTTYTANYTANRYTVTFKSEGVTVSTVENVPHHGNVEQPTRDDVLAIEGAYPTPQSDYRWGGWSQTTDDVTSDMIVTANWEPKDHFYINFDQGTAPAGLSLPDGVTVPSTVTKNDDDTFSVNLEYYKPSPEYSDDVYFTGWKEGDTLMNGENISYVAGGTVEDNTHTLVAQWAAVEKYTITLDLDGGTMPHALSQYGFTTSAPYIRKVKTSIQTTYANVVSWFSGEEPTKNGASFNCWSFSTDGEHFTNYNPSSPTNVGGNITVKAVYDTLYDVTFNLDGGTGTADTLHLRASDPITFPSDPTKSGFIFKGWKYDQGPANDENRYFYGSEFSGGMPANNISFTAQWGQVTVTFRCGYDGLDSVEVSYAPNATNVTIPANWATTHNHDAQGRHYEGRWTLNNSPVEFPYTIGTADITFVSVYSWIYQVTYSQGDHADSTNPGSTSATVFYVQTSTGTTSVQIAANGFNAAENYVFDRWMSDNNTPYTAGNNYDLSGNLHLTAQWKVVQHTVKFMNGATTVKTSQVDHGGSVTFPTSSEVSGMTPPTAGYEFQHWTITGSDTYTNSYSGTVTSDLTFTAVWEAPAPAGVQANITFYDTWNQENVNSTALNVTIATGVPTIESITTAAGASNMPGNGTYTMVLDGDAPNITAAGDYTINVTRHKYDVEDYVGQDFTVLTTIIGVRKTGAWADPDAAAPSESAASAALAGKYYLANHITLPSGGYGWAVLGWTQNNDMPFTGVFDGGGHKIGTGTNPIHNNQDGTYVGFYTKVSGTIRNLGLAFGGIEGSNYVGGITGELMSGGLIQNCSVTVNDAIDASNYVGGIAGSSAGTIRSCFVNIANILGNYYLGGITGQNTGTVEECYAIAAFLNGYETYVQNSLRDYIFEVMMNKDLDTINSCTLPINKTYNSVYALYVGGIVGRNTSIIRNCAFNNHYGDNMNATNYMGGICGLNTSTGSVTSCWCNTDYYNNHYNCASANIYSVVRSMTVEYDSRQQELTSIWNYQNSGSTGTLTSGNFPYYYGRLQNNAYSGVLFNYHNTGNYFNKATVNDYKNVCVNFVNTLLPYYQTSQEDLEAAWEFDNLMVGKNEGTVSNLYTIHPTSGVDLGNGYTISAENIKAWSSQSGYSSDKWDFGTSSQYPVPSSITIAILTSVR